MWRLSRYIVAVPLIFSGLVYGQFGNEWIDFAQSYYKIKIVKDNFYRITQSELQVAGFPISSVPASRVQLFRRGEEIAIHVNANGDGTLNYLEFYGQGIDGTGDTPLYDPDDQPHTFYNLFSDTATYFLTYKLGSENGKRMTFSSDKDASGLTAESYHLADTIQIFSGSYALGIRFGPSSELTLSKYDRGEGWTGSFRRRKGEFTNHNFVLNNFTSSQDPVCDFVLIGGNSLSHNAGINVGPSSSSLSTLGSVKFDGWGSVFDSLLIPSSTIGAGGELTIQVLREGFPSLREYFSVAYMRVEYPQSMSMNAGENKMFSLTDPSAPKAYLQITTTNASGTSIFDINDPVNPIRIATTTFSDRVEAVIPNFVEDHKVLATTNPSSVALIKSVSLTEPYLSSKNFLIITHENLRASGDPINEYKHYRESVAGGNFEVAIMEVNKLYDLFNYGDPSPLGIRNYIQYAASIGNPEYIFLIGKGFTPEHNYYRGSQSQVNVPTFGLPGSDLMYTLGINTDPDLPGIPIGRLNAFTPADVKAYLDKIVEMEALPFDNLWRKDFLQLSGGRTQHELSSFIAYIQSFTTILEKDFIGGRAFNTGKETNEVVEFIDIADRINQGVGYMTFFGHSSRDNADIEVGRVSNPEFGYQNKGRYPIVLVNGCMAGEIFGKDGELSFGEDWMITPDRGAVGFIAHAASAAPYTLKQWSDLFYEIGFANDIFIGESVGNVLTEVSARYLAAHGNENTSLAQVQQMLYEGDPAYRIFGADHPDYAIDNASVFAQALEGMEIFAYQGSFKINIVVKNFGRSVLDSLTVQVDRRLSDGTMLPYTFLFQRPLRQDTLELFITNDSTLDNSGQNIFHIQLDPINTITELNETNNSATLELSIFSGNTPHLLPLDNGTTSSDQVELVWQSSNLLEDERSFDLEIDSEATFDSPNKRSFTIISELLAKFSFDFSQFGLADSSTIYWRTRFTDPEPDEAAGWVTTSFTLVDDIADGWGQYEADQINNASIKGVEFSQSSGSWEFIHTTTPIDISTFGAGNSTLSYEDIEAIIGGVDFMVTSAPRYFRGSLCRSNTLNAIAFDKESGDPYRPIQVSSIDEFNTEVCGRLPQRIYSFNEGDILTRGRLQVLIDNMKDGDAIVLFNIGDVTYSHWDASVEHTLNALGISSSAINGLTDGQPVIFFGRKGDAPGTAMQVINNGSATPITQQRIELKNDVMGSFTSGTIRTNRIGPARDWLRYSFNISEEVNDNYILSVYGVDQHGTTSSLPIFERSSAEAIDISSVDETIYPELELQFTFDDATNLTPPQLNVWEMNYALPPEGILLATDKSVSSFQEGEEIVREVSFYNYSLVDFSDSLDVQVTLINQTSGSTQTNSMKIPPPLAGDSMEFSVRFSSFGFKGLNSLILNVMPNENEMYDFNNRLTLANFIAVQADETNPVLDVTFDGNHILDGDIVSPTPNISIRMRDDNPFVFKKDTTGINISLKPPGEGNLFQRVNFSNPSLSFTSAGESEDVEINYQPGPLDDGIYGLRVQVEDGSGNEAGAEPFEITFEVINESSVTHFYPYPNPFSTSCRFVFTLTGSEIPDQIKIQILTVSGRVVREITQDEIGFIQVGNNITDYAWDGRDEFGDRLANGVYFYRVFVNSNGHKVVQRTTSADRAFKNGFGKLYILR